MDYVAAARLLPIGLAGSASRDTTWVVGVHMLTDALLERGDSAMAQLWARWASRVAPRFPIDSNAFPPRVSRALLQARAAIGESSTADSAVVTTIEAAGDASTGRGQLRLARGAAAQFAVVEGLGTMLPGESRALAAGNYTIRFTPDRGAPYAVAREVLPGFVTVLAPRAIRPPDPPPPPPPSRPVAPPAPVVRGSGLSAAGSNACVVLANGALTCWGDNSLGQLGAGFVDSVRRTPAIVSFEDTLRTVSSGATHSCALTTTGKAYCWGFGVNGELGSGRLTSSTAPAPVAGGQVFVQVAAGGSHTCAIARAGTVQCWGANRDGQIGNRTSTPAPSPVAATTPAGMTFTAVTAGASHTCALASNGAVYCWGANDDGQLGNGSTSNANAPTLIQAGVQFRSVSAGGAHTCAVATSGTAYCWGSNAAGQVGAGATEPTEPRPVMVVGGLTFDSVASGDTHSCGLTANGTAYCWGAGRAGQLGNGQMADSPRPVLVIGGHVFRALGLGQSHSCGAAADEIMRCWGSNAQGQLGSLGGRGSATPVPVLVRPAPRSAASGLFVINSVRERFDDGNWTAAPAWAADSATGSRLAITDGALDASRRGARGATDATGVTIPVRIPVTRATQIQFDVMVQADTTHLGCGINCARWPATVRLRVRNNDLTESEVWYAFSGDGGTGRSFGSVVIVGRGDAPAGQWLREQRFTVRDALPRADTIVQISLGGIGGDFAARYDNVYAPLPALAAVEIAPDSLSLGTATPTGALRARTKDATGGELPWVRVTWSSSDTTVARVDSLGVVTALKTGRAMVRATSGTVGDSASVNVRMGPARRTPPVRRRRP